MFEKVITCKGRLALVVRRKTLIKIVATLIVIVLVLAAPLLSHVGIRKDLRWVAVMGIAAVVCLVLMEYWDAVCLEECDRCGCKDCQETAQRIRRQKRSQAMSTCRSSAQRHKLRRL